MIALNFISATERLRLVESGFHLKWDLEATLVSRDRQKTAISCRS